MLKNQGEKICSVSSYSMCAFMKNWLFCGLCKKKKKTLLKRLILALFFFIFLDRVHKKVCFLKRLREHVGCENLYAIFYFEFFSNILKYISNKGSMYTQELKHLIRSISLTKNYIMITEEVFWLSGLTYYRKCIKSKFWNVKKKNRM
jgi:hypothetical protein